MIPSAHHDPDRRAIDAVRRAAHVFADAAQPDLGPVLAPLGAAPLVLLGEATHGSEEFHRRAELTLRLLDERGFDAVAVEADWPDALRVCRWLDRTRAVTPLDPSTLWQEEGEPQLAPTGM